MITPTVRLDVADGVGTITLDRAEAMNSLDVATKEQLLAAVTQAGDDDAVRCVVLTGSGRAFCVGQDLKEHVGLLRRREAGEPAEQLFDTVEKHYNPIVTALATMPKPVVAAVGGVAAGAGASLTLACDLRILADTAGYNFAFAGVALSCDTGASYHLPRLVGRTRAMQLLYFPTTISAAEALEIGLATRVVPEAELAATVDDLATRLAQGPTVAYAAMRAAVAYATDHPLAESLAFEGRMMDRTGASRDHVRAVDAFLAKERPLFEGR